MIRLFVAIAVPYETAAALEPLAERIPGARWSPGENLHITLRFIGDVVETTAEDIDSALSMVSSAPFAVSLAGVGGFGDDRSGQSLWAGAEGGEGLRILHGRCESAVRRAGLKPDPRVWKPHVTLAYLSGAEQARVAAWIQANSLFRSPTFHAERFGLYSSWRTRTGSAYRLERAYRLRA